MISTFSSLMEPIIGIISNFLSGVDPGIAIVCLSIALLTLTHFLTSKPRVYLVDFSSYRPPEFHKRTREFLIGQAISTKAFNEGSITFMKKMLERSGIGQESYVPTSIIQVPHQPCMKDARAEAKQVVFGALDELLEKSRLGVEDIGILVVNCSLFGPSPSLASMIVNHYKLREDVISYNLGGMGCSAGLISIDLANQLLQVHPNTYALVVSTENMTLNCYYGNHRPMLVTNSLFRMGCGAILLSNRRADKLSSKYELMHTVRTNIGPNDQAYGCVFQEEDEKGTIGISLSKELMVVAGEALKTNITTLGPIVLPVTEKLKFLWSMVQRKVLKMKVKAYMPDFKLAIEHFCIHAGGRAVLDAIEKNLNLSKWHMEPSRMTLWRWGNTSSSSLWYELAYTEAKGRVKKGDRLWQIAFGSGFKCNSVVWKAIRAVHPHQEKNPWMVDIDQFPVEIPTITTINT